MPTTAKDLIHVGGNRYQDPNTGDFLDFHSVNNDGTVRFKKVPVDTSTGAGFGERAMASLKSGPEGRRQYYEQKYGPGNARLSPTDPEEVEIKKNNQWMRADESGPGWATLPTLPATPLSYLVWQQARR